VSNLGVLRRSERDIDHCGPDDPIPPNRVNTSVQVALVRAEMAKEGLAALAVPLDEVGRLEWVSGFSGSNGQVVLTMDQALLWTDGRYFIQAANQLDCQWKLMKMGEEGVPDLSNWIASLGSGLAGADPSLVGAEQWGEWEETMRKGGVSLTKVENLIDRVWTEGNGRPPNIHKQVVVHPMKFAGESWQDKVGRLRTDLTELNLVGMVVTEHDEVAWLLNLRGEGSSHLSGLFHSPTFQGMVLVLMDKLVFWVDIAKLDSNVLEHLSSPDCEASNICVELRQLDERVGELAQLAEQLDQGLKLGLSRPSTYLSGAMYDIYSAVPEEKRTLINSPVLLMKAIKNEVEVNGMMEAHARDSAALCSWAAMMEQQMEREAATNWTEISAAESLAGFRASQENSRGTSFGTISAFGSNGAIIHYSPTPETDARITRDGLFMVDSGGQYLDGTTDVTRTFHYGTPTEEMIERYTDVLQGAIELARVKAPDGTLDSSVDLATRQFLFQQGLDYRHGTGHGIGAYLEVHEGPTLIRMANKESSKLKAGIFFSDEPGFYKEGQFGLRLETILRVVSEDNNGSEFGDFISFRPVTLVPFEPKLIRYSKLSPEQIEWLNGYNQQIMTDVAPRLEQSGDQVGLSWTTARTQWVSPRLSHVFSDF